CPRLVRHGDGDRGRLLGKPSDIGGLARLARLEGRGELVRAGVAVVEDGRGAVLVVEVDHDLVEGDGLLGGVLDAHRHEHALAGDLAGTLGADRGGLDRDEAGLDAVREARLLVELDRVEHVEGRVEVRGLLARLGRGDGLARAGLRLGRGRDGGARERGRRGRGSRGCGRGIGGRYRVIRRVRTAREDRDQDDSESQHRERDEEPHLRLPAHRQLSRHVIPPLPRAESRYRPNPDIPSISVRIHPAGPSSCGPVPREGEASSTARTTANAAHLNVSPAAAPVGPHLAAPPPTPPRLRTANSTPSRATSFWRPCPCSTAATVAAHATKPTPASATAKVSPAPRYCSPRIRTTTCSRQTTSGTASTAQATSPAARRAPSRRA